MNLADLETMDRAALLAAWSDLFGTPAPKAMSRMFLRQFVAFEVQARQRGGLTVAVRKILEVEPGQRAPAH